ncbi:uncharacterized protein LOC124458106 isoform X2 [Xenia sp. Carnegie-2017]|uniref:uncharacterized protein LOC124458106 isoform X2 n=1 Tax=Xenia sp. Carnegie-2017 TaxID=2897299 RepID=UPI001F04A5A6|nr:uncharacterized protein LOC124458106 isoform X2 [Xenia sp. Carnegie-2017]
MLEMYKERNLQQMVCFILLINFLCLPDTIFTEGNVKLNARHGSLPSKLILRNITTSKVNECLKHCLEDCSCLSFQICEMGCQLLSSTITAEIINQDEKRECQHFTMSLSIQKDTSNYSTENCSVKIDCCYTSNYCSNNGKCQQLTYLTSEVRALCKCKEGFVGKRCEKKAKSCQNFHGRSNGWYQIITNENKMVKVYCQFDTAHVWTLVMSYSFKLRARYRYQPYYKNFSRNEANETWEDYRLPLYAMKSIKDDGNTLWRITCSYGDKDWNKTDLVVATHENAPILKQNNDNAVCLNVSFIDIKGYECNDCRIPFWQNDKQVFHTDNSHDNSKCNLKNFQSSGCSNSDGSGGEDNFGYYDCYNTTHRCASSESATTQLWFGERMNSK